MPEIHIDLAQCLNKELAAQGHSLNIKQNKSWQPSELLNKFSTLIIKNGSPVLKIKAGKAFASVFVKRMNESYEYESIQQAVAYLPKLYTRYVRGEGSGIWITSQIDKGYTLVKENSIFDDLFTDGFLKGLLKELGAVGAIVRTIKERNEGGDKFTEYELKWMKSNKCVSTTLNARKTQQKKNC